ncbi:HD-GYP domain-containing protein [Comamonas endophytica]|uniref:HD domain-containing protein n=1 Tax=Comamonas endophytica TaxID=2949090 RepID=A0ABY6GBV2_9BURK|nr:MULTISPECIES: HD domain-containing phosphohydrolase [unclassified Acidovorax]MCD2512010.1 HD domain-containing protein [Acidovorax sp. D4N7]UYG51790.1 HD domain-containing protein [Acidovorax sp. 5MLIR]
MSTTASPDLDVVPDDLRDSAHFLRAVTELAEKDNVITHSPIYTDRGIKLVESGARIDSRLYDRLVQAPLRESIDHNLMVDNMVCIQSIEAEVMVQCETMPLVRRLGEKLGGVERLLAPLRFIPLPMPIAFKLTLMREQRPELYSHSLQMMLVALYLALEAGWSERDCVPLAAAGLLHDIGMLYMPPAWTDPAHKLSPEERKQLVAHSVTAMWVLREQQVYTPAVQLAVLEHHECMDGSGYPRGLQREQISPMGQMLILAEVVSAFHEKYADMPGPRLSLMLRMNHRRYPPDLVEKILPLLAVEVDTGLEMEPLMAEVEAMAALLGRHFAHWAQLRAPLAPPALAPAAAKPPRPLDRAVVWLDGRLKALEQELAQAGSHPKQLRDLLGYLRDDLQGMAELALLHREAVWQLETIANGCLRRWPQLLERATPTDEALADWCQAVSAAGAPREPETR